MDNSWEEEATQPATQPLPPHNGIAPSDSAGQDYSGVICFLHPCSPAAIAIVRRAQSANSNLVVRLPIPEDSTKGRRAPQDDPHADDEADPESTQVDDHGRDTAIDLALRYKPGPKDPLLGFLFGRNPFKCDILMIDNLNSRRISNMHFRIYVNTRGALMLEDMSTNGTWVDDKCLVKGGDAGRKRVLSPGSIIFMCPGGSDELIRFVVRIPKDSGKGLKPVVTPDRPPASGARFVRSPASPPPQFGLPRMDGAPPGAIQSPQQKNSAAIMRNPRLARRNPEERHHREADQTVEPDLHTMREPSGSMVWGGDFRYSLSSQIGKGAFATVNKAFERQTGEVVAVKVIAKRTFAAQIGKENLGVKKEVNILEQLKHPNIVRYITCFEDNTHVYLVMEYIEFGDLNVYLNDHRTMSEDVTKEVTRQVLYGLEYIHKMGISHRDLKPDNVLIANNDPIHVKLSDFGLAKMVNNDETFLKTFCGTMLYLAPEVFPGYMSVLMGNAQGLEGTNKRKRLPADDPRGPGNPAKRITKSKRERIPYNQAVDMWSLGCVIYCLLCGAPPFEGKNQDEMCRLVTRGEFDEGKLKSCVGADNDECVDFLRKLLQVRPEMRMMETEALKHGWLCEGSEGGSISMGFDEDEVQGVETSARSRASRQTMEEEDGDNEVGESEEESNEEECDEEEGLPTPRPNRTVNKELQDSMARVSFSQSDPFDLQTSDNGTSSGNEEDYESLVNSRQEFPQGETGISVIDRARADARNLNISFQGSSGVFPDGGLQLSSSEDSGQRFPAGQRLGDAFEYEHKHRNAREPGRPKQQTGTECRLNRLAFDTVASPDDHFSTPPSHPKNSQQVPSVMSPFSFSAGANAHFNLSPESLRNPSPRQPRVPATSPITAPPVTVQPNLEDDDLPSTQSVCSQVEDSKFRIPPIPWGRLIPLHGSIATDPIILIEQLVSFGRASNCSIKPDDIRISKFHFAIQIHYPDRPRQTDPRESRVGEWRPTPNMVVSFQVLGRSGVYINGKRFADNSIGRLWDGDVVELFRDFTTERPEVFGYKVELTVGDVKRDNNSNCATSHYTHGFFETVRRDAAAVAAGGRDGGFSVASTEIPGGMSGGGGGEMRVRA